MPLVLRANGQGKATWYVDAAYSVHPKMQSHTGAAFSLGIKLFVNISKKQKLVSRSSTEAEGIGVYDVLPQILWMRNFLIAQGYHLTDNLIQQDNKSSILLKENDCWSRSKQTRHIIMQYFFVTDQVKCGNCSIEYCLTEDMWADYFTKALQGSMFVTMRNHIMGCSASEYVR